MVTIKNQKYNTPPVKQIYHMLHAQFHSLNLCIDYEKLYLVFIQVDKKITTNQSKIMNTINSITEFAGNITILRCYKYDYIVLLKITQNMWF
jgi:hypothetical protein